MLFELFQTSVKSYFFEEQIKERTFWLLFIIPHIILKVKKNGDKTTVIIEERWSLQIGDFYGIN